MPPLRLNDREFLEPQYKDSTNVVARIRLHQRFSVNKQGWHPWVFDHFDLPPRCRILELGCGPGYLWRDNLERIPPGWDITLSDFSAGMLADARRMLEGTHFFQYKVIDVQSIPFGNGTFDFAIANHMLYHVPDRPAALAEIHRILKPGGIFHTSTVGEQHLIEIATLIAKFDPALAAWGRVADPFTLENGMAQLSPWFTDIRLHRYEDALEVTDPFVLADYVLSGWAAHIIGQRKASFYEFVSAEMKNRGGVFHITKDSGLFVSVRKGNENEN
jgi:ubiquinone/menaquinone biosynthesis C-methylase UbiE